ncbi:SGNH/GDSL hydrolase family protein [Acinetobacter sp. YH12064]|uniref:SGNH/GDSL hydrolase family protein n=1 Tax=Acinetobacter sp. YH12064 TaxID=2601062 RepID=UPI0015D3645E|nr:SGNH/GDSL hydrolase family protein [Acinetobacter sp. YH12064]
MTPIITPNKMSQLERDIEDIGKTLNTKAIITPREGEAYKSLPLAVQEVLDTGGFEPFETEALLKASVPVLDKKAAYSLDTHKIWLWENGGWSDTGLSATDQAKSYTQDQLSKLIFEPSDTDVINTSKNMYATANDVVDFYITNKTAANPFVINSLTGTRLQKMPVKSGESYLVYMPNWTAADLLAFSLSKDGSVTANKKLVQVELIATSDANIKKFVIPYGFNYLFFNTKIPTTSHDATTTLVINKHNAKLAGFDNAINPPSISESQLTVSSVAKNLATNEVTGFYLSSTTNATPAQVRTLTNGAIQVFPVEPGKTYAVYSTNFSPNLFAMGASVDSSVVNNKQTTLLTLSDTSNVNVKLFTVPSGMNYVFATTLIPSLSFDVRSVFWVNEGTATSKFDVQTVTAIKGAEIRDPLAQQRLNDLNIVQTSVLKDKKWIAIGDSITEKNIRANKNYHDFICEDVGGMTVYNKGISGSGFHDRMNVADTLTEQADYITVFWGTNDFGLVRNTYPLGTFLSTDIETISGRINACLNALITKYPLAKIAIISALPRLTNYGSNAAPNSVGYTLKQHVDLLKQYAAHYSLPFLNLYEQSNLPVWIPAANQYYFTAPASTTPDGLHPNDAGQRVMADKIRFFLESI